MRLESDKSKIESFMTALGRQVRGPGKIYLTGGATAVLFGWRPMTVDIDIKPDPEPLGLFEAIAELKEKLGVNIELAAPDQFVPALPDSRTRCIFIGLRNKLEFYHYDPYGQALAKLQRGHERDRSDLQSLLREGLIEQKRLRELFQKIEPQLIRYPALDARALRATVLKFCDEP